MPKAFLDTTVLVDSTLKDAKKRRNTTQALARFERRLMPVYAIKEFKAGPLSYFAWFHNKLASSKTFAEAIAALQALSRTPQRYRTATALEALQGAAADFRGLTTPTLQARYGATATLDSMLLDLVRTNVQHVIYSAWKKRRRIASEVVAEMPCYTELGPSMRRGLIELKPTDCDKAVACSLAGRIKADPALLQKLHDVAKAGAASKRENAKRAAVLKNLVRKPREPLPHQGCRALGDAVFVILAPPDSVIVTTNLTDYEPLAYAAEKKVERP